MLRRSVVAGGMVLVLIASAALAQPPKGPGGRGGPRFGPGMGAMRVSSMMLLGIPDVQKELKLDEQQQDQIKELVAESQKQMRAAFAGMDFQKMRDMSQEERTKFVAESQKKMEAANKELDAKVAKILDAGQRDRLEQLKLQREGVGAFSRPEIAKKLGLSEEQQAKIRQIQEEARKPPAGGAFPGPDATPEERQEFFAQMRKRGEKVQADILAVLTDQQKEKWTEMKGKEFKFPQFGPGGPGGFGGGKAGERRRPPAPKDE